MVNGEFRTLRRLRLLALTCLASLVCCIASQTVVGGGEASIGERFQRPAVKLTDPGARGKWLVGDRVSLAWRQRRLAGAELEVQISGDGGSSWRTVGTTRAERGRFTWTVEGPWGAALLRLRCTSGGSCVVSRSRVVHVIAPIRQVTAAGSAMFILHEDGQVRVLGTIGTSSSVRSHYLGRRPRWRRPAVLRIPGFDHVSSISGTYQAVVVTRTDGSAWIWGPFNAFEGMRSRQIPNVHDAVWARCGIWGVLVGTRDGRTVGFGVNPWGFYGEDVQEGVEQVRDIPELRNVTDISLGFEHGLALQRDGTVLSFGGNSLGQLGDPAVEGRTTPAPIPGLRDVVAVSAAGSSSLALRSDGTVWIWGDDQFLSPARDADVFWVPTRIDGLERVVAVENGGLASVALRDDGAVFAWGLNASGLLTDDERLTRPYVVQCRVPAAKRLFFTGTALIEAVDGGVLFWGRLPLRDAYGRWQTTTPLPFYPR